MVRGFGSIVTGARDERPEEGAGLGEGRAVGRGVGRAPGTEVVKCKKFRDLLVFIKNF